MLGNNILQSFFATNSLQLFSGPGFVFNGSAHHLHPQSATPIYFTPIFINFHKKFHCQYPQSLNAALTTTCKLHTLFHNNFYSTIVYPHTNYFVSRRLQQQRTTKQPFDSSTRGAAIAFRGEVQCNSPHCGVNTITCAHTYICMCVGVFFDCKTHDRQFGKLLSCHMNSTRECQVKFTAERL